MKNARGHASQRREVSFFTLYARPVPGTWAAGVGCARDADAATSGMDSGRTAATWPWLDPSCSLVRMEQPGGARCSIVCALIHAPPLVGPENFTTKNIVPRFTISRCRIAFQSSSPFSTQSGQVGGDGGDCSWSAARKRRSNIALRPSGKPTQHVTRRLASSANERATGHPRSQFTSSRSHHAV